MTILFIGDIVGKPGREAVKTILPKLKEEYSFDLVIANGENLSHGKGITQKVIDEMINAGINFFTSGNHIWKQKEMQDKLNDKSFPVIRPANYPPLVPGHGWKIVKTGLLKKVAVMNLIGRVFFPQQFDCPFRKADEILKEIAAEDPEIIIVDFHGEVTSEKMAIKHYLDGRVQAIIGTHTHVPTADAQITDLGTAYVTDAGMTGLKDGIIGFDKQNILKQFLTQMPQLHEITDGPTILNAVAIDFEDGQAVKIEQIIREAD